jgi:antirestriction protein
MTLTNWSTAMNTATATRTAVYVGTYAKYNDGNLAGEWLDLEDYTDKQDFLAACKELHKDEADPEFMFEDWEGIPDGMIGECFIEDAAFEFVQLEEKDRAIVRAYREYVDQSASADDAIEAYRGTYESPADYAESFHCETGSLQNVPEDLAYHIDWESVAREMGHGGTTFVEVAYHQCLVFVD